ncbi:MAG: ATP-binding cassette domain-containing protein [Phycisphaera sp.]|nr:ATP-binding cassette domain-containing protein [Phycisphaera sp.]
MLGQGVHRAEHARPTLGDMLSSTARKLTRGTADIVSGKKSENQNAPREFWALRGVDFTIGQGEVVGIIGRNGAGKSTLLKLLSRITDPTDGQADLYGRVGSLLEVGTGFHPELTGRENVYLNGSILGMTRSEIKKNFDEIVAFSEVEKFLDTPVKRYSSGMYVRLAFAVAAHLEPEILIVDEVLAVGDAKFQAKCLAKMKDVANRGQTVLFVSHNMGAVEALCGRGIVLESGKVVCDSTAEQAIQHYLRGLEDNTSIDLSQRTDRRGSGGNRVTSVQISGDSTLDGIGLRTGHTARFTIKMTKPIKDALCVLTFVDNYGQSLIDLRSKPTSEEDTRLTEPTDTLECVVDEWPTVPGRYRLDIEVWEGSRIRHDTIEGAVFFNVAPGHMRGRSIAEPIRLAKITLPHRWTLP